MFLQYRIEIFHSMRDRIVSFAYESTVDTEPDLSSASFSCSDSIASLSVLESRLLEVLKDLDDCGRLTKAKSLLERYSGSDWMEFASDPSKNPECIIGYERAHVASHSGLFDLLVLSWSPGAKSPIHNHPCERCFLMALTGSMQEIRFKKNADGKLHLVEVLPIPKGIATWISDDIGLHSVRNGGSNISFSLHCYVPGFTQPCTIYDALTGESSLITMKTCPSRST